MFSLARLCLLATVTAQLVGSAIGQSTSQATAILIVHTPSGVAFGSGAFVSGDGLVLTCYHVLQDATTISLINGNRLVSDNAITVEKIDPDHDLATLRVRDAKLHYSYYALGNDSPQPTDEMWILGYIGGLANQTVSVRTTQTGFASSGKFLNGARSVFARSDVQLIPLNTLIYNGMSGAPLLFKGRTIGVVSGSLNEGASLAWAIPVGYLNSPSMQFLGRPAASVKWPSLRLMGTNWSNLRRQLVIDSDFANSLNDMLVASSDAVRIYNQFTPGALELFDSWISNQRQLLETVARSEDNLPLKESPGYARVRDRMRTLNKELNDRPSGPLDEAIDHFYDDIDKWNDAVEDLDNELNTLSLSSEQQRLKGIVRDIGKQIKDTADADKSNSLPSCVIIQGGFVDDQLDEEKITVGTLREAFSSNCTSVQHLQVRRLGNLVNLLPGLGAAVQGMLQESTLKALEASVR